MFPVLNGNLMFIILVFFETLILVMIYAGPVYLFVGLPLSIFIDKLIEKSNCKSVWTRYFVGLGLYSLFGIFVGFIFLYYLFEIIIYIIWKFFYIQYTALSHQIFIIICYC